jgi:hypothetical protein
VSMCDPGCGRLARPAIGVGRIELFRSLTSQENHRSFSPHSAEVGYATSREENTREKNNDQIDCCCWLCRSRRNFGASNNTGDDSSAGRHDHASPLGVRPVQDQS